MDQIDYEKEFDDAVEKYNRWLKSIKQISKKPKAKQISKWNKWRNYLIGAGSIIDLFPNQTKINIKKKHIHPLYSRKDLTLQQKQAISLASDLKRVNKTLDKIISGNLLDKDISPEGAKERKQIASDWYNHFKKIYVSETILQSQ